MSLKSVEFREFYNKNKGHDIPNLLYKPCLENSILYRRVTAYYRLSAIPCYLSAIPQFVRNSGKIQIICSPELDASDTKKIMEAIKDGAIESDFIKVYEDKLLREIQSANDEEAEIDEIVSLLIRLNILQIKIAIPRNGEGFLHKKIGYFKDSDGNILTFSGSGNETKSGLDPNGNDELIEITTTWKGGSIGITTERISIVDELWNETVTNTQVYDLPTCVQNNLLVFSESMAKRSRDEVIAHLEGLVEEYLRKRDVNVNIMPGINLRKHQQEAIKNWLESGRRGIFDHCTGSGKTLTAIWLILDSLRRRETPLIVVPRKLLLYYWQEELLKWLPSENVHIILCGDNNNEWKRDIPLDICSEDKRNKSGDQFVIIVIAHTACSEEFQKRLQKGEHLFIVGDECHNYGSSKFSSQILTLECGPRLGLSATPNRHGDPDGALKIVSYFGPVIEPVVSISDGINSKPPFLSRYEYHPHFCNLNDQEIEQYEKITKKIGALFGSNPNIDKKDSNLTFLIAQRSKIWKKAESKISLAIDIIKDHYVENQKWLIFCEEEDQLRQLKNKLINLVRGPLLEYLSRNSDKENHLKLFKDHHGVLLAIRCLDEGIDIPDATHAIILASSQNSAQFIQRRGRVLRICEGKEYAVIYDAFVLPPTDKKFESLIKGEIERGIAFANDAINGVHASTQIRTKTFDYPTESDEFRNKIGDWEEREVEDNYDEST